MSGPRGPVGPTNPRVTSEGEEPPSLPTPHPWGPRTPPLRASTDGDSSLDSGRVCGLQPVSRFSGFTVTPSLPLFWSLLAAWLRANAGRSPRFCRLGHSGMGPHCRNKSFSSAPPPPRACYLVHPGPDRIPAGARSPSPSGDSSRTLTTPGTAVQPLLPVLAAPHPHPKRYLGQCWPPLVLPS